MSKKTLFLITGAVVLVVFLGIARAIQVHIEESAAELHRAEQMAKAQDAMKQLQQQLGAYSHMQQNMPKPANMPNLANMNLPGPSISTAFTGTIEYKYERTQNTCLNNVCNFLEETRELTGTFDLQTDSRGGGVAGGNGKAMVNTMRFGKYTNEKCAKTGRQTLEGEMEVSTSAGGMGSMGWLKLDAGSNNLSAKSNDTPLCSSEVVHKEWNTAGYNVRCNFTDVDLAKGGTFTTPADLDEGYGTCKIVLTQSK